MHAVCAGSLLQAVRLHDVWRDQDLEEVRIMDAYRIHLRSIGWIASRTQAGRNYGNDED